METIFDHNVTADEIEEFAFLNPLAQELTHGVEFPDPLTKEGYAATITPEGAKFDLYQLFRYRRDMNRAKQYATGIEDKVQQYELGFDYKITE